MGVSFLTSQPLLSALIALVITFLAVAWFSGAFRSGREEARAGLALLCAMRWNEYSRLISEMLKDRGLQPSTTERHPGQDGFDLLFTRGTGRYLVQCTNATRQHVTAAAVGQLHALTQMQGADGSIIVACATAEPAALKLARDRRIEILAGTELWHQLQPWVAHDQSLDARNSALAFQRKRFLLAALGALLAATGVYVLASALKTPAAPEPIVASAPASQVQAASPRPAQVPVAAPALPDAHLSTKQLESRRASAVQEVRSLGRVETAIWSSQSTLQASVRRPLPEAELTVLVSDICNSLLQFEELRFTRLQLEVPTDKPGQPSQVRWRQCR